MSGGKHTFGVFGLGALGFSFGLSDPRRHGGFRGGGPGRRARQAGNSTLLCPALLYTLLYSTLFYSVLFYSTLL